MTAEAPGTADSADGADGADGAGRVSPPRPLLVLDHLATNGANHIAVRLASAWARDGARLAVLQSTDGAEVPVPTGVAVERLTGRGRRLRVAAPAAVLRLLRAARRSGAVVTCSEIGPMVLLGWVAARATGRPFVVSVHADLDDAVEEWVAPVARRALRSVHRRADAAICVDEGVVEPVVRNGLPRERVRVVRNGIDTAAVRRGGAEPLPPLERPLPEGLPVLVATGRVAHQKGYDLLVRAHARVVAQHPHVVLVLNDGPERAALAGLVRELGVEDTFRVEAAVRAPLPLVARADAFLLPSRHEGLPLALLEALALGAPCIASASSDGVVDALDGGRVGRLVPVEDVDALAAAVTEHLVDPAPLRALAAGAAAHADRYDLSAMADGWARALCGAAAR